MSTATPAEARLVEVLRRRPVGAADDEDERLAVLRSYGVLDTEPEAVFDELALLAAEICDTPMATITLVDENRQWFKSRIGVEDAENVRDHSLCAHALHRPDPLVVTDTRLDPRFQHNPLVQGAPGIRFYAGAPLVTPEGLTLGTLCVMDTVARTLSVAQTAHLVLLGRQVMAHLAGRRLSRRLAAEVASLRATARDLSATDRLLRGVLADPEAVIYAKDLDGRYILGNEPLHTLMNRPAGSLMGLSDRDLVDPAVADTLRDTDREVARRGLRLVRRETLPHPDGSLRHYLSTKFPLRREDGSIYAVAGISTDISAQIGAARGDLVAERRWRQLFDEAPVGIGLCDADGVFVVANTALCALVGRSPDEVVGATMTAFGHPDDAAVIAAAWTSWCRDDAEVVQVERRYLRPDGEQRWAWLTLTSTPGPAGERWTLAHTQDITERLAGEQAVRDSEANLAAVARVVRQIQDGSDARRAIVAACGELTGARFVCLFEPDSHDQGLRVTCTDVDGYRNLSLTRERPSAVWRAFDAIGDTAVTEPAGSVFPGPAAGDSTVVAVPVRAGLTVVAVLALGFDGEVPAAEDRRSVVVRLLATQAAVAIRQTALMADLTARAETDPLTELPNRRGWGEAVQALIRDHDGHRIVVALVDFDQFKRFNDTRGHAAGDELLRGFAQRARSVLRTDDVLARWGGEEFALALPCCDSGAADTALRRVLASMPAGQTCSIGFAELGPDHDIGQAMIEADAALYVAKTSGRNQIRRF